MLMTREAADDRERMEIEKMKGEKPLSRDYSHSKCSQHGETEREIMQNEEGDEKDSGNAIENETFERDNTMHVGYEESPL